MFIDMYRAKYERFIENYLRQFFSSEGGIIVSNESPQSSSPSHLHDLAIHLPFEHLKSLDKQSFFKWTEASTKN